ncbi:helicase-associated domain-containing protein [Phytoactinopolyspora limicola]|uniref:helicase-associated domain-containing protein n=1 Tax=Phytoactinopolyspora limicola TaxID=2715536 RepID=UPI001407EADE|nr:helicase-associated domain-containing protein [Phytoactinopolyspora limicola]
MFHSHPQEADPQLIAWLRRLSTDDLAQVLAHRADVLVPPWPRDLDQLALRLSEPKSAAVVIDQLPLPCLELIDAIRLATDLGGGTAPASADVVGWLDRALPGDVESVLRQLAAHGLAWTDNGGRIHLNQVVGDEVKLHNLGSPMAELLPRFTVEELKQIAAALGLSIAGRKQNIVDRLVVWFGRAGNVRHLFAQATADTREILEEIAWRGPNSDLTPRFGYTSGYPHRADQSMSPGVWAVRHGFVVYDAYEYTSHMPLEICLALRGPDFRLPFTPNRPALPVTPMEPQQVSAEASATALRALDRVVSVVEYASTTPIPLLKSGGVGTRAISAITKKLGSSTPETTLAVELAIQGLLLERQPVDSGDDQPPSRRKGRSRKRRAEPEPAQQLVPSAAFAPWQAMPSSTRLRSLLVDWWNLGWAPLADQKFLNSVFDGPHGLFHEVHGIVFQVLSEHDGALTDRSALATSVGWHVPRIRDDVIAELTNATLTEASLLGLVAAGVLSDAGRALVAHPSPAVDVNSSDLVDAVDVLVAGARTTALFGTDLTAVVTGSADADLASLLDQAADRESQGAATSWRFTPASIRRAFDTGSTAQKLIGDLTSISANHELPQPLVYMINDVERRHGEVSVIHAASVIVSADSTLVTEIAAHRRLAKLQLGQVAPTVLVASSGVSDTLEALRSAGYVPVQKRVDGSAVLSVERAADATPSSAAAPRSTGKVYMGGRDASFTELGPPLDDAEPDPDDDLIRRQMEAPQDPVEHAKRLLGEPPEVETAVAGPGRSGGIRPAFRDLFGKSSGPDWTQLIIRLQYGVPTRITYHDDDGQTSSLLISDVTYDGEALEVWCWDTADYRRLDLSRIEPLSTSGDVR